MMSHVTRCVTKMGAPEGEGREGTYRVSRASTSYSPPLDVSVGAVADFDPSKVSLPAVASLPVPLERLTSVLEVDNFMKSKLLTASEGRAAALSLSLSPPSLS